MDENTNVNPEENNAGLFEPAKEPEPKVKRTVITCPHCSGEIIIEKKAGTTNRGQLLGLTLEEMTDEQLKREIINSKSVLYKAEKRGASAELIAKNQERVDAAMAEKAKREPAAAAPGPNVTVTAGAPGAGEGVYKEGEGGLSSEI